MSSWNDCGGPIKLSWRVFLKFQSLEYITVDGDAMARDKALPGLCFTNTVYRMD